MGARFVHFNITHFLGRMAQKKPVGHLGCLESPGEQNLFGSSHFSRDAESSLPDSPLSVSDLDSVGSFLWLDGGTSEGPQGNTKGGHEYSMPNSHWGGVGGGAHLFSACGVRSFLLLTRGSTHRRGHMWDREGQELCTGHRSPSSTY